MPTEQELLQHYGPEIHHFTHAIKDDAGKILSQEELFIRRVIEPPSYGTEIVHLSLLDREGRRIAKNDHSQRDRIIKSGITSRHVGILSISRVVGEHNTGIPNPYRNVPGAAAALIVQYLLLQKDTIDAWYSSDLKDLSGRRTTEPHTARYLYAHTLNTHYGDLVRSRLVGRRYIVTAK